MFGFGLTKLVLLAGVIAAVWYGFKLVGQLDRARKAQQRGKPARPAADRRAEQVEDTVQCPACGAYVVAGSASPCERPDCPY